MENVQIMLFRIVLAIMVLAGFIWFIPFGLIALPLSMLDNGMVSWRMLTIGYKPLLIIINFVMQDNMTSEEFFDKSRRLL